MSVGSITTAKMRRQYGADGHWRRAMKRAAALAVILLGLAIKPAFATDTVYYYHTDALRSEVVITDATHKVVERTYYGPYGEVLNRPLRDGPGYTGHEEDAATGLDNMQQRYYDPINGRFPSVDPMDVETTTAANFNRYAYAADNPYRYVDPDGRGNLSADQKEEKRKKWEFAMSGSIAGRAGGAAFLRGFSVGDITAVENWLGGARAALGAVDVGAVGLGGVAAGALVYPIQTASDDTMTAQAVKDSARPISSWKPERGDYLYRACGGGSTCLFGNSWTPINPFFLRMAGVNFRDEAGLPNWNTGRYVARGQLVNPAGITEIKGADAFGTHGTGVPNRGGLIEFVIPDPQTTLQNITTTYSDPAF